MSTSQIGDPLISNRGVIEIGFASPYPPPLPATMICVQNLREYTGRLPNDSGYLFSCPIYVAHAISR